MDGPEPPRWSCNPPEMQEKRRGGGDGEWRPGRTAGKTLFEHRHEPESGGGGWRSGKKGGSEILYRNFLSI